MSSRRACECGLEFPEPANEENERRHRNGRKHRERMASKRQQGSLDAFIVRQGNFFSSFSFMHLAIDVICLLD